MEAMDLARGLRARFPSLPFWIHEGKVVIEAPVDINGIMTAEGLKVRDYLTKPDLLLHKGRRKWTVVVL